jgi:large subunit ribosomal protein L18
VSGTAEKPRVTVYRSAKHIYVQAIDDISRLTLASASDAEVQGKNGVERSSEVGKAMGKKLSELGIEKGLFDRSGYKYHGLIASFVTELRNNGIKI